MGATAYLIAQHAYAWLLLLMALACCAGIIGNVGGTRRIALVIASAALLAQCLDMAGWPGLPRLMALTVINGLAAVPLLIRPVTARQQVIAAWFMAVMVMHCVFAASWATTGDASAIALTINWALSAMVDAIQSLLLLWWSGGHAVRVVADRLRRRGVAPSGAAPVRPAG